jgi:soluble lytic murein transglycosylase
MLQQITNFALSLLLITTALSLSCSAQQTEEQALASLRAMTSGGKLPAENVVADFESRFANRRTGALARLLRARIKLESGDFVGAAAILNSDVFAKRTKLADHALWLRGQALNKAGNHAEALKVFDELLRSHPESVRVRDAKLLWATSAIAANRAVDVPAFLVELTMKNDREALLLTARAYEAQGATPEAISYYRKALYVSGYTNGGARELEDKLRTLGAALEPQTPAEHLLNAGSLLDQKRYSDAAAAFQRYLSNYPTHATVQSRLRALNAFANSGDLNAARNLLAALPASEEDVRQEGYRQIVLGYAKAKMWPQVRQTADEMRRNFPDGALVPKTLIDAGLAARDQKNRMEEGYFLNLAHTAYPNAIEVAQAQFEAAWYQHELGNVAIASQMFIDHLARYVDKDNTNRGKAGYWAARDSERAGKTAEACALYDGVIYRYSANWYGYLAVQRLTTMKNAGQCRSTAAPNETIARAVANLKVVTVAAETAGERELARAEKSDELSIVGLFDWAIDELNEAKRTAPNSPKINLALARHYTWKGDRVNALLSLAKSYPDYSQMFPEEMGREEWEIFYPLTNWAEIKYWAGMRGLDKYQVAGLIRQETIFDTRAKSPANAYGLMQLLVPTANSMAKKYVSKTSQVTAVDLYQPPLNIELGTAYMRDQIDKFGRIEYVAIAYNAGPGRVGPWRASLPPEIDEFVEAIPFRETKAYVQGVIRNTAQYRRLYDENGQFKPNVGTRPLRGEIDSKSRDQLLADFPDLMIDESKED